MSMRRRLIGMTALALICASGSRANGTLVHVDRVVAVVNETVITQFDIQKELMGLARSLHSPARRREFQENAERIAGDLLRQFIQEELIYAEFKEREFTIPTALLQERLDRIIHQETGGDRAAFRERLRQGPVTMSELREMIERRIAVDLMVQENVTRQVHVSPEEVKAYYQDHEEAFRQPGQCRLRMVAVDASGLDNQRRQERTREMARKGLARGESPPRPLPELAEELGGAYSDELYLLNPNADSENEEQEGYPLRPELREYVMTMKEGERTGPIGLEGQLLLIELVERKQAGRRPLDPRLRSAIRQRIEEDKRQKLMDEFIGELKKKHHWKQIPVEQG